MANIFVHQIHVNNPWRYLQYLKCMMRALLELSTYVRIVEYPLYIEPVTQTLSSPGLQDQSSDFYPPSFPRFTENHKAEKKVYIFFSAQAQGLLCEEAGNYGDNVKYCGYCVHHYKKLVSH